MYWRGLNWLLRSYHRNLLRLLWSTRCTHLHHLLFHAEITLRIDRKQHFFRYLWRQVDPLFLVVKELHAHGEHDLVESVDHLGVDKREHLLADVPLELSLLHDLSHLGWCEETERLSVERSVDLVEPLDFLWLKIPW